jgi:transcriptional regulator with XRE-family HTH domain
VNFQEYFKGAFEKTGLSAAEFCLKAKISKPLFYFYMQGKRTPAPDTMAKLATALGVEQKDFEHLGRASMGRPPVTVVPAEEGQK